VVANVLDGKAQFVLDIPLGIVLHRDRDLEFVKDVISILSFRVGHELGTRNIGEHHLRAISEWPYYLPGLT
jgi:hypothetical protein